MIQSAIPGMLGEVYHYRDSEGLECDAIVHLRDESYGLIEIKIGGESLINDAELRTDGMDMPRLERVRFVLRTVFEN